VGEEFGVGGGLSAAAEEAGGEREAERCGLHGRISGMQGSDAAAQGV